MNKIKEHSYSYDKLFYMSSDKSITLILTKKRIILYGQEGFYNIEFAENRKITINDYEQKQKNKEKQ